MTAKHDKPDDKPELAMLEKVDPGYDHDDPESAHHKVADSAAANYVDPTLVITEEESKAMRWRIHKRILPLLCLAYLTQSLDKGTLGVASIMGWQHDVGTTSEGYALAGTILWCGIIAGEPLANQFVRRFPTAKLLSAGIFVWSVLDLGLAFALDMKYVLPIRFLLGFFEALVGPCLLSITVQWYLKSEQPFVSSCWQCMIGAQSIISGLLGFGFYHLTNAKGLRGWQWLTVAISLYSFSVSAIVFLFLPDAPTSARWLTEEEKVKFVERVRPNNQGIKQKYFKREQVYEALTDPFTYLLFFMAVFQTMVVGGVNKFNLLLFNKAFGFNVLQSQLLNLPQGAMTVFVYLLMSYLITRTKQTLFCIMGTCIPNLIGTIVLIVVAPTDKTKGGLVVAYYILQFFQGAQPGIFLMLSRNSAGQTKKSITYAITYIGWAGGNAASAQLFRDKWAPRYVNSLYIHIGLYGAFCITCLTTRFLLMYRNRQKAAAQGECGPTNEYAFEDLTDLQNPDFRYTY